jgi:hypothetical protein
LRIGHPGAITAKKAVSQQPFDRGDPTDSHRILPITTALAPTIITSGRRVVSSRILANSHGKDQQRKRPPCSLGIIADYANRVVGSAVQDHRGSLHPLDRAILFPCRAKHDNLDEFSLQ